MRVRLIAIAAAAVLAIALPAAAGLTVHTHPAVPFDCSGATIVPRPTRVTVRGVCWGEATVSESETSIDVALWPAATLEGKFVAPRGAELPSSVTLRLQSAPGVKPELAAIEEACEVKDATWRCAVPAIALDLRIDASGFVPAYVWNVTPATGKTTSVEDIQLSRGASVAGWIRDGAGQPVRGATVSLDAEALPRFGSTDKRKDVRAFTAQTNERGFFQFAGVPPGNYAVTATKKGASPARQPGIRVDRDEVTLPRALELRAVGSLALSIVPPVDAQLRPWMVRIDAHGVPWNLLIPKGQFPASATGELRRDDLESGTYLVSVVDTSGNVRLRRDVQVSERGGLQVLSIDTVDVRGKVTAGRDPVHAALQFIDGGGVRVTFNSDDEGTFSGALPHEGKWIVQCTPSGTFLKRRLRSIDVKRNDDGIAAIVLDLGRGTAKGIVIDEHGDPAEAGVRLFRDGAPDVELRSAADGTFAIRGVDPGPGELQAITFDRRASSELVAVDVKESGGETIQLTLHPRRDIDAWLTTADGTPLPGALIRYLINHVIAEAGSGPSGEFSVVATPGATFVDAIVLPPGDLPITLVHIPTDQQNPRVAVGTIGGSMLVKMAVAPPWPAIRQFATAFPLSMMLQPISGEEHPRDHTREGLLFAVAPGAYSICPDLRASAACVPAVVNAGQRTEVDARPFYAPVSGGPNATKP